MFWVIQSGDRTLLVDTGFSDPDLAAEWNIEGYAHPLDRLHSLGISPQDVDDIILTHAHWDHAGSTALFPNAKIWMQQAEYEYAKSRLSPERPTAPGMRWTDLGALMIAKAEGRLHLVDGSASPVDGIQLRLAPGHTPGSQIVMVETLDGTVMLAGDNAHLYRNHQSHIPVGSAFDPDANLAIIREMHRMAASTFLIVPGHDPLVMEYFPTTADGIVEITMQARRP
jgi:glyoxylase-like metal-dependent hydrolase (beta-lactamase superfamily II)